MNKNELLELAAKAYWAGEINDVCSVLWIPEEDCIGYTHVDNQDHNGVDHEFLWNPLENYWDTFRLQVKMKFNIVIFEPTDDGEGLDEPCFGVIEISREHDCEPIYSHYFKSGEDRLSVTCYAITRAAAEIGKQFS